MAEVLTWLLADAQLAQAVRSCAAAGVQAKLILVDQPDKVGACGVCFLCCSCIAGRWYLEAHGACVAAAANASTALGLHVTIIPQVIASSEPKKAVNRPHGLAQQTYLPDNHSALPTHHCTGQGMTVARHQAQSVVVR